MSEARSSQRQNLSRRDSSVTQVRRTELPLAASASATADDQATVISSRPTGSSDDLPPLLPPLEVGRLLEGEQLGQFELRQFVGGGGMGVVFRGWDTALNREVAVKVLSHDQSGDEETVRRFRNEAQSAARLDHPNIARVYGMGEDRGVHYIIFEFIEGVNLRDLVDRHGPLPVDEAIDYTLQLAEALEHASQQGVIHRDIKPSNVLITAEGNAKLVDMGLARQHQVEHTGGDLTASGVTLGTFDYISPEQARDPRSADVRSDLYSLGCSLYFMLAGRPPFPNGTVLQKLLQHQGDTPPDLRQVRRDLPMPLVRAVSRLLAKSPAQRYQTPTALIDDLALIRRRLHKPQSRFLAGVSLGWRPRVPAVVRRHVPWAIPLATLIAISLALDFYWTRIDGTENLLPVPAIPPPDTLSREPARSVSGPTQSPIKSPASEKKLPSPGSADTRPAAPPSTGPPPQDAADKASSSSKSSTVAAMPAPGGRATNSKRSSDAGKKGILTVGSADAGASHETLQEAIRAAESGDVIELRYSGSRNSAPLVISDKKLIIRAGEGYQPVVRFASTGTGTGEMPSGMIAVDNGNLSLVQVQLEWGVTPGATYKQQNFIELRHTGLLRLEKCVVTVRNGAATAGPGEEVAIIAADDAETGQQAPANSLPPSYVRQPFTIELQNSLVRADAKLVSIASGTSARVVCDNTLLVLAGQVLDVTGPAGVTRSARIEFDARHLTLDAGRGLLTVNLSPENNTNLSVDLRVVDSILRSALGSALIEQRGFHSSEDLAAGISWSGNRNFYDGFDTFWRQTDGRTDGTRLNFTDWKAYWGPARESVSQRDGVVWNTPLVSDRRASEAVPAWYALSTTAASNPAREAASDGLDAGCLLDLLPPVP